LSVLIRLRHRLWGTVYVRNVADCNEGGHDHLWIEATPDRGQALWWEDPDDIGDILRQARRLHCDTFLEPYSYGQEETQNGKRSGS
jgi:hypothetical protein